MDDTALHYATFKENVEIVKYLISLGADISYKNSRKISPWDLAQQIED